MKKLSAMAAFVLLTTLAFAQRVPQGMKYQAVARDLKGQVLADQTLALRINLISGSTKAALVHYSETHEVTTNQFGLFTLVVGEGKIQAGLFDRVPWSSEDIWMEVGIREGGKSQFATLSSSKLLAVPYAFHAATAAELVGKSANPGAVKGDVSRDQPGVVSQNWSVFGNMRTNPDRDFLGTTDYQDLVMITNNIERLRITKDGDVNLKTNLNVGNDVVIGNDLTVKQDVFLNTTGGATINNGPLTVAKGSPTVLTGTLNVNQATDLDNTLNVDGATTLKSTLSVDGATDLNNTLNVDGVATISNQTESTSKTNGAVIVVGGVGIGKNINVGGKGDIDGTLNVDGITTISNSTESTSKTNGALVVVGGVGIGKNINVGGNGDVDGTLNVDGATTLNSTLNVTGNTTIQGVTNVTNTTQSTLPTNGAFIVAGGVGIGKNLNVGGNGDVDGTLNVDGATTLKSSLNVNGNTDLDGTLNADGATTLKSTLSVDGATDLNSTLNADGATTLKSTLSVDGATDLNNTLNVDGAATFNSTIGLNGQVTINADVNGADSDYNAYPLRVQGSNQGIAIKVDGSRNNSNNFVTFLDNNGIQGRIEGQTVGDLESDPVYISDVAILSTSIAVNTVEVAIATAGVVAAAASTTACVGLGICVTAPIPSLIVLAAFELAEATANLALASADLATYIQFRKDQIGVTYQSGAGDYAEWLPKANPAERHVFGTIVGLKGGLISPNTQGAEKVMVISQKPIVLGNTPQSGQESGYEKVAFMGQVPVRVRGNVQPGDYIIPSGRNDGYGVAVARENLKAADYLNIVGIAWSGRKSVSAGDPGMVNVAVGINNNDVARVVVKQENEINDLKRQINRTNELLAKLVPGFEAPGLEVPEQAKTAPAPVKPKQDVALVAPTATTWKPLPGTLESSRIQHMTITREHLLAGLQMFQESLRRSGADLSNHPVFKHFADPAEKEQFINRMLEQVHQQQKLHKEIDGVK